MTTSYFFSFVVAAVGGANLAAFLPNSYEIVQCGLGAPFCKISDLVGRRVFCSVGFAIAGVGALVIGTADHISAVIIGSVLLGGNFVGQGAYYVCRVHEKPTRNA